jgi:hypothetical protein
VAEVPLTRSSSSSDISLDPWAKVAGLEASPPSEAHGSLPGMVAHGSEPGGALDNGTIGWAGGAAAAVVSERPHSAGGHGAALELASLFTYFLDASCCPMTHAAQGLRKALYLEVFTQSSALPVQVG